MEQLWFHHTMFTWQLANYPDIVETLGGVHEALILLIRFYRWRFDGIRLGTGDTTEIEHLDDCIKLHLDPHPIIYRGILVDSREIPEAEESTNVTWHDAEEG